MDARRAVSTPAQPGKARLSLDRTKDLSEAELARPNEDVRAYVCR